ncbi:helix-turn-helix domain-containing protein [Actinoallomurus iriomotensis]|uniref:Transcriptional regulator n=1 Tax=Actinoallomurus iriomotensis TaxID=478107 RepID=A0A9W6RNS4_9ACTN|nr:helix-turn-helix domain-containing protein [Actinoallomurus iriomotensis]GLY79038.1 transcriptional regulator [Actinoallomurus iriomotensis]
MATIRQLTYQPPREASAPVETMSFARLRRLNDGSTQRGDFHVLAVVRRGRGRVSIDFSAHPLAPRDVVWIRPGVVHRWDDLGDLAGDLVLFVPTAPVTPGSRALAADPGVSACWAAADAVWPLVTAALGHLRLEAGATEDARTGELPGLLLSALLLRLDPPAGAGRPGNAVFHRFRDAVEEDFRVHHDVAHYGRRLGYSPRTLSRGVRAATGRTAKDYLCERLLLEAKRLLAHDRLSPARCGRRLGFADASNFSAFFLREAGVRPGAWQSANLIGQR